jgi:CheY-like chemotaxis protein
MTQERVSSLSVLVVEDLPDAAESTALLLVLHGYRVRVAESGPSALVAAEAEMPDVVLLDIGLPGMDGWEVARRMRERTAAKQPVVVAVTGYGAVGDRWRSADAGVDLHLVKPVAPGVLVGMMQRFRRALADNPGQAGRDGCHQGSEIAREFPV